MKDIFADKSDPDNFEIEYSPSFNNKNHRENGNKGEFNNEFNPIQMGTLNAFLPPLNLSDCSHRITPLLREFCYDSFAPLNLKRWEDMRGSETLSELIDLLLGANFERCL